MNSDRPIAIYFLLSLIAVPFCGNVLQAQATKHYIVQLRDEPVISHLAHRMTAAQRRMDLQSADASAFRLQLWSRQAALKRSIESLPSARVKAQVDTVYNGLVVEMRAEDVEAVKQDPAVENVFPSILYRKTLDAAIPLVNVPQAWTNPAIGGEANAGAGVRIAIIDTGIDINHPMFQDPSLTAPSGFPRFTVPTLQCRSSDQLYTNPKVIVARNYVSMLDNPDQNCDAEDRDGHGTFNAGIAAGRRVTAPLASISGVAGKAFLGNYKVTGTPGSNDDAGEGAILAAVDDAIKDGMNVINLSLGAVTTDFPASNPLSVAVANAATAGVTVVVSAGNEGPGTGTITSPAISPAVISVGATSNSRILANPLLIAANVAVPADLQTIGALPGNGPKISTAVGPASLVDVVTSGADAIGCTAAPQGSLAGALAFIPRGGCNFSAKIQNAADAGAVAAIIYNNQIGQPPTLMDVRGATAIPSAMIGNAEGLALARILASPGARVQATLQAQPAAVPTPPNRMASFSSNGPSTDFGIKPDLVAPGTTIYSATQRNFPGGPQYDPSGFTISSGTSHSSPIVAGAAALVKQASPGMTPAQIKSALVNTASKTVASTLGGTADILSEGNGLLNVSIALAAPLTVSPVSLSFGFIPQEGGPAGPANLSITNIGRGADNFTVTGTPTVGAGTTISVSPSSFSLNPGASAAVSVSLNLAAPVGTIEGYLTIQSQLTLTSITVPYWGTSVRPSVEPNGGVSAASLRFGPTSLALGEIISIFGTNLANNEESAVTIPWPDSLGGASLTIGGQTAPMQFASPRQINAQVPFELTGLSFADLVVKLNGFSSTPISISLLPSAPGIFTLNQGGTGGGAILHASDSSPVTTTHPARTGEFLEIFVTGLGEVFPSVPTGDQGSSDPLSTTLSKPTVTIAGIPAPVSFSGLAPGFVGLYQLNLQVPDGVPSGEETLILTSNGVPSNPVTVSIGQ
jgi:minor extracellular serine protease Vpr